MAAIHIQSALNLPGMLDSLLFPQCFVLYTCKMMAGLVKQPAVLIWWDVIRKQYIGLGIGADTSTSYKKWYTILTGRCMLIYPNIWGGGGGDMAASACAM